MTLNLQRFIEIRPFLFHVTFLANLPLIQNERKLFSSKTLLELAGRPNEIATRRLNRTSMRYKDFTIVLNDQKPLHVGNIKFEDGWALKDLLLSLSGRIFFWPGTLEGPKKHGTNYLNRYKNESPVILRIPTTRAFAVNGQAPWNFCRFNTGSPRCVVGRPSPRGPRTFKTASEFSGTAGEVVEVSFQETFALPQETEWTLCSFEDWRNLF